MPSKRALVVAINDYGGPPNDLPSCINDGKAFSQLLRERYGFPEIRTLFDAEATTANVEDGLTWLVTDVTPSDRLVYFFSGHGFTKLVDGVMEEFIVLRDEAGRPALWEDRRLVERTLRLPPRVLSVICDACYSGGMVKWIADPSTPTAAAEIAQVKVYQPSREEQAKSFVPVAGSRSVSGYRRFGCRPLTSTRAIAKTFSPGETSSPVPRAAGPQALSDDSETLQPELNGLLVSACLETETAAASTSRTAGLSAFTHALAQALAGLDGGCSAREVFDATAASLKNNGFRQTPLLLERAEPGNLANCAFLTMEDTKMSEHDQTTTATPGTDEEMQKFATLLAAVIPAAISAAPGIINAIRPQRKSVDLDLDVSTETAATNGEMEKVLLSAILPVLWQQSCLGGAPGSLRKDVALEGTSATGVTDAQTEKFLGLVAAAVPVILNHAPAIINAVRRPSRR